jgi:acetyltransferase-like isoleucine patch superfamily enzyme
MGRGINIIRNSFFSLLAKLVPELNLLKDGSIYWPYLKSYTSDSKIDSLTKLMPPYKISNAEIEEGTYLAPNSTVSFAQIGKYCSIGPNFLCGWGIHPTNGISTSPMFYSTIQQNGRTFSAINKIEERKKIIIGNDVFIGANVTVLDGVMIGDGAIIGAGAVVSKDIPPYAIAVGCPISVIKYRFSQDLIDRLLKIRWWEFKNDKLKDVEKYFFDVESFISKYDTNTSI